MNVRAVVPALCLTAWILLLTVCLASGEPAATANPPEGPEAQYRFAFGPGQAPPGYTRVSPNTIYSKDLGYGFEEGAKITAIDRGGGKC